MSISLNTCIMIVNAFLCANVVAFLALLINRLLTSNKAKKLKIREKSYIKKLAENLETKKAKSYLDRYISRSKDSSNQIKFKRLSSEDRKLQRKYIIRLNSRSKIRRIEAAVKLKRFATKEARDALEKAIQTEKHIQIKLYIANSLADIGDEHSIPVLISTLLGANRWYRNRANMLICDYEEALHDYLPQIIDRSEFEIKELIIDFSGIYISSQLKEYVIDIVNRDINNDHNQENDEIILCKATEILLKIYPKVLIDDKYLASSNSIIRNNAIKALSYDSSYHNLIRLLDFLKNDDSANAAIESIGKIINNQPEYVNKVIEFYNIEKDDNVKTYLAEVLSNKIEYFIMQLSSPSEKLTASRLMLQVLLSGKTSEIINFININKNIDIENEIIPIIKKAIEIDSYLEEQFRRYLNPRLLEKLKLESYEQSTSSKEKKANSKLKKYSFLVLIFVAIIFPAVYIIRYYPIIFTMPILDQLKTYALDFNYYLVFYSFAINLIYLILLLFSAIYVKKLSKLWSIKNRKMLFKRKILPSISIIAPAYNEEKTIVENANSLLNLVYPDYEVIIVNDGSRDNTLKVLINTFELKRVDLKINPKINTMPVMGVYKNTSMPRLTVIDKQNGGKADSLNVGINASSKKLFCGIDADSIIEKEALLKLASMEIDAGVETAALGGNILPANGCKIDHGEITEMNLPKSSLARFQTIEYLRAFMAGRLGWAYIKSLLIISGAFGLFRKSRVIDIGGYLTKSGKYETDTVGEDMELVVRISRELREKKLNYKIDYAYNANCWTEVPEDIGSLRKQRFRWHRGLIEILFFHKKMLFNPAYGRVGRIAMPYFFIFEMLGSLIETQGYIMVVVAAVTGIINYELALLLFVSTILMGTFISITSLLIAEKNLTNIKLKDLMILVLYAVIENFGPRQMISIWRAVGFFKIFKSDNTWEKLKRKGFAKEGGVQIAE